MADEEGGGIEMQDMNNQLEEVDMSGMDYDLEYSIRVNNENDPEDQTQPLIDITRARLDEESFQETMTPTRKPRTLNKERLVDIITPPEPVLSALKPPMSRKEWLQVLLIRIPILKWVWTYQAGFFFGDILSGITVAIMHIPQGLAYALLARVPAVYGLYCSFVPVIIYSVFGTSRHLSVGTFAVVELMIGNAIQDVLHSSGDYEVCIDEYNGTVTANDTDYCDSVKIRVAITLAFSSGIIMLIMGVLKLGFITIFLSTPLISGYTTGAAIHVFTSQLKHITGLDIDVPPGILRVPRTWIAMFNDFTSINPATIIISILCIIPLIIFKITNKYIQKLKVPCPKMIGEPHRHCGTQRIKWPIPIPSQLIVVIVATIVSYLANLEDRYSVPIVGPIPKGAPALTAPDFSLFLQTLSDAFVIAVVTFSVAVSLAAVFAREHDYTINSDQELIAYGLMNIAGCFFSSFPAAGSLSRSTVQSNAGGKTQLVGFISSVIILVVLLWLGILFESIPKAVLASIIWVALYGMFKQFRDVWKYFKLSYWDSFVWVLVFTGTVLLGVDLGLGVGIGVSLLVIIVRTILPYSSILGQAKDTEIFRNIKHFERVKQVPGVIIFRFQAPLCFINSRVFRVRLELACKLYKSLGHKEEGGILQNMFKNGLRKRRSYQVNSNANTNSSGDGLGRDVAAEESGHLNTTDTFARSSSFQQAVEYDIVSVTPPSEPERVTETHTVIVDCAPISFIDAVGVKVLEQTVMDFAKVNVQVLFVGMTKENRDVLSRSGFFHRLGKKWLFPSMQDAVNHAQHGTPLRVTDDSEVQVEESGNAELSGLPNNTTTTINHLQADDDIDNASDVEVQVVPFEEPGDDALNGTVDVGLDKKES